MLYSAFLSMFSWSDLSIIFLLSVSLFGTSIIVTGHFDRRHKRDLDYEKRRIDSENDTQLLKARIYADKDRDIARLENTVYSSIDSSGETDTTQQLIDMALANPNLLNSFLEKIKK